MKKKLIISTDCFLPRWDGIARFLKELLPFFAKEFDVTVLCPDFPGDILQFENVHVHRYPLMNIRFGDIFFAWPGLPSLAKHVEHADLVFNQTLGPIGLATIKAAKKHDVPVAGFVHSLDWELASRAVKYGKWFVDIGVRMLARRKYNQCDVLLTPSVSVNDALFARGIRTRKVAVPLGIDVTTFVPPASKAAAKKAIGIDQKTLVVGFCGRFGREKDLPTLVHAFRRIQHKQDMKLLLVGGERSDLPLKNPRIIMAGRQDNVVPYLQAMDVFVLPSLTETSSLATMEAMACGLPVIATPVGSLKEYIEDGVNGFLFPRQDVDKLAERLNALLKSPKAREAVGIAARKTIEQRGTWQHVAQKITHILHELS